MRNFISIAVILILCFSLLAASFAIVSHQFVKRERRETLETSAEYVAAAVSAFSRAWDLQGFEMRLLLNNTANISGTDVLLCGTDGQVISCSDAELVCRHMANTVPMSVLENIDKDSFYFINGTLSGLFSESRYIYGLPVESQFSGKPICYAFLSTESTFEMDLWRAFFTRFVTVGSLVLLLAFVLSLIISRRQSKPINEIAVAANRFARGDFSTRVTVTPGRNDEISALAESFNSMAESLERSEALRREFVANVSHELKTPLTSITGFSDGLLDGTIPPEKQRNYLTIISSEARRISRLVRSMLEMSQLQATDRSALLQKSFDVSDVIMETLLALEQKINSRGLDVDVNLPEETVTVQGDRDSILQVAYNLLDNAIKFSASPSTLRVELWKQGAKAYVSIENSGQTISQEELPLIFDRFHKTDRSRSLDRDGVGLGLYIVKTILDNHNENIYVTSKDGQTRFVFSLTLKTQ